MTQNYGHTIRACFTGYIVQAVIVTFAPLLFVTFQTTYGIPLAQITLLITVNFAVQLTVDFAAAFFVDKLGYRTSAVAAHIFAASGLLLMAFLPNVMSNAFAGLLLAVIVYAIGGGLLEVLISPIVEACPTKKKAQTMSLLHSFYCWGCVAVIGLSTLFFIIFGTQYWYVLAALWAILPVANAIVFTRVPIAPLLKGDEAGLSFKSICKNKMFWIFMLLIFCAGASEQAVGQWASTFAEQGLGVSKTIGDLSGPLLFSVLMGVSRLVYGKFGGRININIAMAASACLCVASFLIISLTPNPIVALVGVSACGFSVGILWPGTFSSASATVKGGGTAMFAFLALAGDLGCAAGPTFVGLMSDSFGGNLQTGILFGTALPVLLILALLLSGYLRKKSAKQAMLQKPEAP